MIIFLIHEFHFILVITYYFSLRATQENIVVLKTWQKKTPNKYAPFPLTQWAKSGKKCNTKCVFGQKSTIFEKKTIIQDPLL